MPIEQTTTLDEQRNRQPVNQAVTAVSVTGMTCGNCARHVTEAIQSVPEVHSATVNLEAHQASVRWTTGAAQNIPAVIRAIEKEGYGAKVLEIHPRGSAHGDRKLAGWQLNLWIGVLGTLPLMVGDWVFNLGMASWFRWFSFSLAGMVQVFAGSRFYRGAWNQLKVGSSNMDTLVALGSTTAFVYSVWALLGGYGGHVYFMEAAAIITLISVGHWMESRMSLRASSALRELLNLAPQTARRLNRKPSPHPAPANERDRADLQAGPGEQQRASAGHVVPMRAENPESSLRSLPGGGWGEGHFDLSAGTEETEVLVDELKIGDVIALRPGNRVPTDGEVMEGNSAIDESMLTGESVPVDKSPRNELYAGTVNLNGRLLMRVTAMGEETALAHIIAAVQRAQTSRANIQRLGDRVSCVFVPVVVAIAVVSGLWCGLAPGSANQIHHWFARFLWPVHTPMTAMAAAFITAAAVLIVACPCAMGLATPAAIMAGSNAAAKRGILIRDGVALEKAGEVTAVLFDKTGTLTSGKPSLAKAWHAQRLADIPFGSGTKEISDTRTEAGTASALRLAGALAKHSTHPISQAIAKGGFGDADITEWQEMPGAGVQATFAVADGKGRSARLGSLKWLRESHVDFAEGEAFIAEWSAQGATIAGLAVETSLWGLFALKDTVKPGAFSVVQQLHRQGLKTYLVTGDNALTAASVAKQAGIPQENVFAEVRPEQKAEFVIRLQQQGERVAFVGDGINDAPALEQADLGIAVSRASDVAREAADIILLKSEIEAVPESLGLARATLRTIRQNLFWAFFYNAMGVPLAALGFMSPILCAAAMGFSDLIVIGNALRLRNWKLRPVS